MLARGTSLGPYHIIAPIGAGGMGEVYSAHDTRLSRQVAVKVLPAAFSRDQDRLRRFEHEARAAAALNHPNILVVYDVGTETGVPYLVSELLEGETLRSRLHAGPLPPRKAVEYATQISRGLAVAHAKGILHRDLKPENIFLTHEGAYRPARQSGAEPTDWNTRRDRRDRAAGSEDVRRCGTSGWRKDARLQSVAIAWLPAWRAAASVAAPPHADAR